MRLADGTDGLNLIAFDAPCDWPRCCVRPIVHGEARRAIAEAIELFERKGNSWQHLEARDLLDLEVACMSEGGPPMRAFVPSSRVAALARRRAAVGICDERSREREQTDCEHDERAVQ